MGDQLGLFDGQAVPTGPGLELRLWRAALAYPDAAMAAVLAGVPWEQHHLTMFGKRVAVPRLECWIGDEGCSYTYSGIRLDPRPWPAAVEAVRREVEAVTATAFDCVLANRYRDGADGVAWHADDEAELGPEPVIASVSLGEARPFQLRRRDDPAERREVVLGHGDVLLMSGRTQAEWVHRIPRTTRRMGERVNLTFRRILLGRS